MSKKLTKVELYIACRLDTQGAWQTQVSADLYIGIEEYPDFEPRRKGIPIILTPAQETTILNFVRNAVIPQATQNM